VVPAFRSDELLEPPVSTVAMVVTAVALRGALRRGAARRHRRRVGYGTAHAVPCSTAAASPIRCGLFVIRHPPHVRGVRRLAAAVHSYGTGYTTFAQRESLRHRPAAHGLGGEVRAGRVPADRCAPPLPREAGPFLGPAGRGTVGSGRTGAAHERPVPPRRRPSPPRPRPACGPATRARTGPRPHRADRGRPRRRPSASAGGGRPVRASSCHHPCHRADHPGTGPWGRRRLADLPWSLSSRSRGPLRERLDWRWAAASRARTPGRYRPQGQKGGFSRALGSWEKGSSPEADRLRVDGQRRGMAIDRSRRTGSVSRRDQCGATTTEAEGPVPTALVALTVKVHLTFGLILL
jgi:hypothetical protein